MKKLITLIAVVVFALGLNFIVHPTNVGAAPAPAEDGTKNGGNNGNNGNNGNEGDNGNNGNNGNSENEPKGPGHNE
jgi:hypothetical protein